MVKRNLLVISAILIAIFAVTASGRAVIPSTPGSPATPHTTGVDIQILNVVPTLTYQPTIVSPPIATGVGLDVNEFPGVTANASMSFAFAPNQGFTVVNKVLVTIVYLGGSGNYNGFLVSLNGHSENFVPGLTVQNSATGTLTASDLNAGANTINVGLSLVNPTALASTFVYQVKATVEYTYIS